MSITFYGERGLVNSILLDMDSDLEKQKKFLKAIVFEDGQEKNWIENVTEFHYIVEPSFAQFGDPDLIIIAEEKEKKHVLFVEAKVHSYEDDSIALNENLLPSSYKGIASKLNIQLALRYRFNKNYHCKLKENGYLSEKIKYFEEDAINAKDRYHDNARALKKTKVVELCTDNFGKDPEFLFIALTNDKIDFKPFTVPTLLPAIGKDNWKQDKNQFGLVSYEMLEQNNVIDRSKGYFELAARYFLGLPANTGANPNDRPISTTDMKNWDQKLYDELERYYNKPHTDIKIEKLKGSYSIKDADGRTLVKLYVENDRIQIAFRNDNVDNKLADGKERVKVGSGRSYKSFIVVYPNIDQITDEIENEIRNFCKL
ncbi:hypothetical protein [Acetobacterium wieringae]|uniref:hypothetical protein n=1 Tax=Acetobacterium wieringae TaxID=52694 RepID=UPI0026EDCAAE|nr:hypothetical protein [Acetobacterium wieringae]